MMRFLLLVLLVACGAPPAAPTAPPHSSSTQPTALTGHETMQVTDFAATQAQGVTLIDVRTPGEYASGHLPGAVNMPLDELDPRKIDLAGHDKDAKVYLVCQSGRRSQRAAEMFSAAGYKAVNLAGGTQGWADAGNPLEK